MMEQLCFLKKRSVCGRGDFLRELFRLVGSEVFLGFFFFSGALDNAQDLEMQ